MPSPTSRTKVVVCRQWAHPNIEAFLFSDSVGARMGLEDFVDALAAAVGNPAMILTKEQLKMRLRAACSAVSEEMKFATKHVV